MGQKVQHARKRGKPPQAPASKCLEIGIDAKRFFDSPPSPCLTSKNQTLHGETDRTETEKLTTRRRPRTVGDQGTTILVQHKVDATPLEGCQGVGHLSGHTPSNEIVGGGMSPRLTSLFK